MRPCPTGRRHFNMQGVAMIHPRYLTFIIGLVAFFLLNNPASASEWILYDQSVIGNMYYDKSSIKKMNQHIIQVWDKTLYNENGRKNHFAFLQTIGQSPARADALHHQLVLIELDYHRKKYRIVSSSIYNKKNKVIAVIPNEAYDGWREIRAKSVSETLLNRICLNTGVCKRNIK